MSTIAKYIGIQIRKRRKELKINQEALGDYIGLSRASVVNLEQGRSETTFEKLWLIASALGCKDVGVFFPPPKKCVIKKKLVRRKIIVKTRYANTISSR
jgi:transcriptional regulator with XRE-family HTH domain